MASQGPSRRIRPIAGILFALFTLLPAYPALALRVVNYNILNYPGTTGAARAPYYRTILAPLAADIIVTEEISSASGPTQFLNEVLNVIEPGQWATVPFIDGNDTDSSIFYKPSRVQFLEQSAFYPNPSSPLRYVHIYRIQPVGYTSPAAELRIYSAHLKASTGYESQRLAECTGIRSNMNSMPAGMHALLCGDLNFYKQSTESGYGRLMESQTNNIGRLYDLLPGGEWHDNASFARYHTQSTCLSGACANGAATGGMDDRFDFVLPTMNLGTGQGMAVIPNSCVAVGNDGQHLNKSITDSPTIPEGAAYATALQLASDHLPVRIDLQLPAEIATDAALAFGTVIVGAPAQARSLTVSNPAVAPADSLNCVFAAPAGFFAPLTLAVASRETSAATISMSAASTGVKTGDLAISSDSPDNPAVQVGLSGTVLDHAIASLDSTAIVLSGALDFGDHEAGGFVPHRARVHNTGYSALQALLWVSGAVIEGGEGRFTLADAFTGSMVGGTGYPIALLFDDEGATLDSTYTATLTITSSDQPLPGAAARPDLVLTLRAKVVRGPVGVFDAPAPVATRLYDPSPNPSVGRSALRLDVARRIDADLTVFDPSGRRVATIARGAMEPGRYTLTWDGLSESGSLVRSGVYFVRLRAPGLRTQVVRLAVVH